MKKIDIVEVYDSVCFIEDGINAAHVVALASDNILTEEERDEAIEWIFENLSNATNNLRAELTEVICEMKKLKAAQ